MRSNDDGACSAGDDDDVNSRCSGGVGFARAARSASGDKNMSARCGVERTVEGSERCGRWCPYRGGILRRRRRTAELRCEIQNAPVASCGRRRTRGGCGRVPLGFSSRVASPGCSGWTRASGRSSSASVACTVRSSPARGRRRAGARCGSGERCGGMYRLMCWRSHTVGQKDPLRWGRVWKFQLHAARGWGTIFASGTPLRHANTSCFLGNPKIGPQKYAFRAAVGGRFSSK